MTLGFGIVTSMFTALFVTRLIFVTLIDRGVLHDLGMFKLIGQPKIDWLALRRKFWPISTILVVVGLVTFVGASKRDAESVYDIEFLGGTSVQIELNQGVGLSDEQVRRRVTQGEGQRMSSVQWLNQAADALAAADVAAGNSQTQFVVTSDTLTGTQLAALMQTKQRGRTDALVDRLEAGGVTVESHACRFDTKLIEESGTAAEDDDDGESASRDRVMTLPEFEAARDEAVAYARRAAENLGAARIQTVHDIEEEGTASANAFEIITVESNRQLVQEAILAAFDPNELAVEQPIEFKLVTDGEHPEGYYPIEEDMRYLSEAIGGEANFDVRGFKGGLALILDELNPPQTIAGLKKRMKEIQLLPGYEGGSRKFDVFGLTVGPNAGEETYRKVALVVVDPELPYYEDPDRWTQAVAAPELQKAGEALRSQKTLRKVVQFAPQIADQAKNEAILAIAVALAAIVAYVWIRFGTMQYGLAAIVALVHDVSITLGLITLSDYFHGGAVGEFLLIRDFKIDLPMIAAMLTIIGYSLNDTIVVFDRIRENRGKLSTLTPQMINTSINQTLSRTLLTSVTTFLVVAIMYFLGGPGVHGFAYALVIGVIVGTYSSVGVAAPLLFRPRLLHIIMYLLVALGLFGAASVATSSTPFLAVIGAIIAAALVAALYIETRSERDYSRLVTAG
ncbi:MAG: protein translocase subunit SecF [bacterium]|nr:protein translocase subunit SecF [bacterium]